MYLVLNYNNILIQKVKCKHGSEPNSVLFFYKNCKNKAQKQPISFNNDFVYKIISLKLTDN